MKRAWALAAAALGLVIVWWYWRVEGPISDSELNFLNYDLYSYYYPTVRFAFAELQRGHLALWNPYQLAGEPFFANQQHGLLYPLNVLYTVLPAQRAFQCSAILHYVIAALCAVYLGHTLELSAGASAVAALTFTFGGYLPGLLYLRTWLNGAVWLPLEFALAVRIFREQRRAPAALLLTAILAAQYLGGYPLYSLLSGYCLLSFAVWQSVALAQQRRWRQLRRADVALALAPLGAAALCAVQLLPMIEMTELSPRQLGALSRLAVPAVYGPGQLRTLFVPLAAPGSRASTYVGGAILPLLAAALLHRRLRSMAAFFMVLALLAATLAAGSATPLYGLYQHLPTSMWFRFPGEFVYLVAFGLSFAGGIGVDALTQGPGWPRAARLGWIAVPVVLVALLIRIHPFAPPFTWAGRTTSVTLIAAAALFLCMAARTRRFAWLVLLAAVWLDLSLAFANYFIIPDTTPDRFEPPAAIVRFLQDHLDAQRVYFHVPPLQPPPAKMGMRYGVFTIADHESLLPLRYAEYIAQLQDGSALAAFRPPQGGLYLDPRRKRVALLDLLGVRYLVSFGPNPFANADEAARYPQVSADGAARVYENPHALPRAFVVGTAEVVAPSTMLARLAAPGFDALGTALVEAPDAALTGGSSRAAAITAYSSERVSVHVSGGDAPGLLILTDQFYPGWQASLDGTPVPIYPADYVFRGVPVPAGEHTVTFSYRPFTLRLGAWVTAASLIALALTIGFLSRRSRLTTRGK